MSDLISRQAVLELLQMKYFGKDLYKAIYDLPSAENKGEWIDDKCSVCGKGIEDLISSCEWYRNEEPNFCPFCGVQIKSEE